MIELVVTGCAGYVGSLLCDILTQNSDYHITGIDKFIHNNQFAIHNLLARPNFNFVHSDILSAPITLFKDKVVIHLAAIVGASLCDKDVNECYNSNVLSTIRVVDLSKRVIFLNTNSGYGKGSEDKCTEESPLLPVSLYGQTKVQAEQYVLTNSNNVSLRLATVFGASPRPRMDLMVNDFVAKMMFDKEFIIFEPNFRRNFVHIKDVCAAVIWSLNPNINGIFNVGLDSANTTKIGLAEQIKNIVRSNTNIIIGEGKDPDQRDYIVSSDKIMNTGFKFKHSLEEGVKEIQCLCNIYGKKVKDFKN